MTVYSLFFSANIHPTIFNHLFMAFRTIKSGSKYPQRACAYEAMEVTDMCTGVSTQGSQFLTA